MTGSRLSKSDDLTVTYVSAEFKPSRVVASRKSPKISLVKVPKFAADQWRSAGCDSVVGIIFDDSYDSTKRLLAVRDPESGGLCKLDAVPVKANEVCVLRQVNLEQAEVLCVLQDRINFVPQLRGGYQEILRERRHAADVCRARGTIEEMRRDPGLDTFNTLFQFYQPKYIGDDTGEDSSKRGVIESVSRTRAKQKRIAIMDADLLKVKLFSMFESAGSSGLQLKQISVLTQQPLSHVKNVVEDIAEQRKRASDRKSVYFLKSHYNPQAVLGDESSSVKKLRK